MAFETIQTAVDGAVGIITFNRPEVLNAFNHRLIGEVNASMNSFSNDESIRAIVVRGNGRAFSAGFDMKESAAEIIEDTGGWTRKLAEQYEFIIQFWNCPKPTIASIHGFCLAGAFELALACDITVAAEGTRLGEPEVRFGSGISALLLPWISNPKFTAELLLTGDDQVDAVRAREMGVVNWVVPQGAEFEKAMTLAHAVASSSQSAVSVTRRAIKRTYDMMGMRQALLAAFDSDVILASTGSPERKEFARIRREKGLKEALAWRDSKFRPG